MGVVERGDDASEPSKPGDNDGAMHQLVTGTENIESAWPPALREPEDVDNCGDCVEHQRQSDSPHWEPV